MVNVVKLAAVGKRFWALGIAKGWTELRAAKHPPVPHTSRQDITGKRKIHGGYGIDQLGYYTRLPDKWVDKQIKLEVVTFIGGKVLGTVPSARLRNVAKLTVSVGGMVEVSPEVVAKLLEAKI